MNNSVIRLCSLRATDGGARLALSIEIKSEAGVETEALAPMSSRLDVLPQVGEISAEELDFYREESLFADALVKGYRVLACANISPLALLQKLQAADIPKARARAVLAYLTETGMIREEENVLHETEKCFSKLWGDHRILMTLHAKGYRGEAINVALERMGEEDSTARCVRLIEKRRLSLADEEQDRRRLIATLFRYGYTSENVRDAIRIAQENTKRR